MAETPTPAKNGNGISGIIKTLIVSVFGYLGSMQLFTRDLPPWSGKLLSDYGPIVLFLGALLFVAYWWVPRDKFSGGKASDTLREVVELVRIELARLSERMIRYDAIFQPYVAGLIKADKLPEFDECVDKFGRKDAHHTEEDLERFLLLLATRKLDKLDDQQTASVELLITRVHERIGSLQKGEIVQLPRSVESMLADRGKPQDQLEDEQRARGERAKRNGEKK